MARSLQLPKQEVTDMSLMYLVVGVYLVSTGSPWIGGALIIWALLPEGRVQQKQS